MSKSKEEKLAIFSELFLMALSDNFLRKEELTYLAAVGKRLELAEEDMQHVFMHPEKLEITVPKTFSSRMIHFHRLIMMMKIDGEVNLKELELLHNIALRYGFRQSTVEQLLQLMDKHPDGDIDVKDLLSIHQTGVN